MSRKRSVPLTGFLVVGLAVFLVGAILGCATTGRGKEDFFASGTDGKTMSALGLDQRLIAVRSQTGGNFEVLEGVWPPGGGFAHHIHGFGEAYYVAEGAMTVKHGDKTFVASEGSFGFIPAGMVHSWKNESADKRCKLILFFTPSFGDGYEEVMDGLARLSPDDPNYMTQVAELFAKVGATQFVE